MVRVVFSYGPSCLNIRADQFSLTGRLVSARVVREPSCLVPIPSTLPSKHMSAAPLIKQVVSTQSESHSETNITINMKSDIQFKYKHVMQTTTKSDRRDFLPKYTQIHPNIPKYTQIHPNILKYTIKLYYFYYFEMLYE